MNGEKALILADHTEASSEASHSRHLHPIRSSGSKPPLIFVLPGDGPHDMWEFIPQDQPIYEFYLQEVGEEKGLFPTFEQIATGCVQSLRKVQCHGPYQICGYSNGGYIAYEIARLLVAQGEDVSFLALFDTWHPKYSQDWTLREQVQFKMFYFQNCLLKYTRFMILRRIHGRNGHRASLGEKEGRINMVARDELYFRKARPSGTESDEVRP